MKVIINESQIRSAVSRLLIEQETTAPTANNFILGMENSQISANREDVLRLLNFIFFNFDPESEKSNTELTDRFATKRYGYNYGQLCKDLREGNLDKLTLNDVIGLYLASRFADEEFDSNTLRPVQVGSAGIKIQDILLNLNKILADFKFTQSISDVVKFLKLFVSGGLEARYTAPAPESALPSFTSRPTTPGGQSATTTYDELYRTLIEGSVGDVNKYVKQLHDWTAEVVSPIAGRAEKIYNIISNPGLDVLYAGDLKTIAETMVQNHKNPATVPYTAIRSSMLADFALINSANRAYISGAAMEGATVGIGVASLIAGKLITDAFAKMEVLPRFTSWFWRDVSKIESRIANAEQRIKIGKEAAQESRNLPSTARYNKLLDEIEALRLRMNAELEKLGVETESLRDAGFGAAVTPTGKLSSRASSIQSDVLARAAHNNEYSRVARSATAAKANLERLRQPANQADIKAELMKTDPVAAQFYEKYMIRGEPAPGIDAPEGTAGSFAKARAAQRQAGEAEAEGRSKLQQLASEPIPEYFDLDIEVKNLTKLVENLQKIKVQLQNDIGISDQELSNLYNLVGGRKALRTGAWSGSLLTSYAMTMGATFLVLYYLKETLAWESTLSIFEGYVKESLEGRMSVMAGQRPLGSARPLGVYSSTFNPVQDACEDWTSPFELTKQFQSATGQIDAKDYTDLAKAAGEFAKEANLAGVTPKTAADLEAALKKVTT